MYERCFSLSANPFSLTPDPKFLYLTAEHRDALTGLTYAMLSRKGITVLTGDAGTGKTTLLRAVMRNMSSSRVRFSFVTNPILSPEEFFRTALSEFGITGKERDKGEILSVLRSSLIRAQREDVSLVLVVDEAHRLSSALLEEVRLLTNFETDSEKLLQILLVGQDELDALLDTYELRQLKQRVAIRLRINPLTPAQVSEYIRHRWSKVSDTACPFDEKASEAVAGYSRGVPRLINVLCDNALLHVFAEGSSRVTRSIIRIVAAELHLEESCSPPVATESVGTPLASLNAYLPGKRWSIRFGTRQETV